MVTEIKNINEKLIELNILEKIFIDNIIIYKENNFINILIEDKLYEYTTGHCKFDADKVAAKMSSWGVGNVRFCTHHCWIQAEYDILDKLKENFDKVKDFGNYVYSISFR